MRNSRLKWLTVVIYVTIIFRIDAQKDISYYNWLVDSIIITEVKANESNYGILAYKFIKRRLIYKEKEYFLNPRKKSKFINNNSQSIEDFVNSQMKIKLPYTGANWFMNFVFLIDKEGNVTEVLFSGNPKTRGLEHDLELEEILLKTKWKTKRKMFKKVNRMEYVHLVLK